MLRVLDSNRARLKTAAALVNMERELYSLISYYPIIDRILTKAAGVLHDSKQLSIVIRNAMQSIENQKRLVAINNDALRAVHFIRRVLESLAESAIYIFWRRQDGLNLFSHPPTEYSDADPWQRIDANHPFFLQVILSNNPGQWSKWSK